MARSGIRAKANVEPIGFGSSCGQGYCDGRSGVTDRLTLTRALEGSGMQSDAAERIATEIYDAIHDNVATKTDLRELEQRLDLRFERLDRQIDRVVIRLVATVVIALTVLFGALHYIPPAHGAEAFGGARYLLLIGDAKEPDELILRCEGTVGSIMPSSWIKNDELIGVHIKNREITLSGNDFLLGQNIKLCPAGTLGTPSDTWYFDSGGCGGKALTQTRQYGTFNTILMKLDVTNTTDRILITGRFKCMKASPL
jgi:hypothetical protein